MALIVSLLLVCLCLLTLNIYLLFPIKKDLNFVKYMNHTEDEFSAMHKLSFSKKEDEYTSTARYLISKYIEIYESIKIVEPKYQENFIRNNSIHKIYQGFQEKRIMKLVICLYLKENRQHKCNNIIYWSIDQGLSYICWKCYCSFYNRAK